MDGMKMLAVLQLIHWEEEVEGQCDTNHWVNR